MIKEVPVWCPDCGKLETISKNCQMPDGVELIMVSCSYCHGLTEHFQLRYYDEDGVQLW
jgi:hypothetical protein